MNHTTAPQASDDARHVPVKRLQHYNPKVEQRVQGWFASGQPLVWIPILSQENFPDVPQQLLEFADNYQEAMRWPIHQMEELLQLPNGIGEIYILGIKDRRTGKPQTLLGERVEVATGQADDLEQRAV